MKAVITVTGKDKSGIVAIVSQKCAEYGANISEISQSIIDGYFVMIMLADISKLTIEFSDFVDVLEKVGEEANLIIHTMHEKIFDTMHTI